MLEVNTAKATAPQLSTHIPHILQQAANCFDQLQQDKVTLQEELIKTRKELSHALYQHDAACHVIARLQTENQELTHRLTNSDTRVEELNERIRN